jgi:hypothetical protein
MELDINAETLIRSEMLRIEELKEKIQIVSPQRRKRSDRK